MRKTICLDFNGVLDNYQGWVDGGDGTEYGPKDGVDVFLQELSKNFNVVVCTAIAPSSVRAWLNRYDLHKYVSSVTNKKPIASVYVDDRAISFNGNFDGLLEQIKTFKPYWDGV